MVHLCLYVVQEINGGGWAVNACSFVMAQDGLGALVEHGLEVSPAVALRLRDSDPGRCQGLSQPKTDPSKSSLYLEE